MGNGKVFQGIDWGNNMPAMGVHTATSGDASADAVAFDSAKPGATGFMVQVWRAGVNIGLDVKASILAGVLTVEDGSTYKITASDVIMWMVW